MIRLCCEASVELTFCEKGFLGDQMVSCLHGLASSVSSQAQVGWRMLQRATASLNPNSEERTANEESYTSEGRVVAGRKAKSEERKVESEERRTKKLACCASDIDISEPP
jgi:predicted Zn-dependent protease